MFACPILRQQSTQGNPPMRLVCGHVISKDALNKLCNGNKYVIYAIICYRREFIFVMFQIEMSILPNGTVTHRSKICIFLIICT